MDSMQFRTKFQRVYICEHKDKVILKLTWKCRNPRTAKTIVKKNKMKELILSDVKSYYKARIIKISWYWCTRKEMDRCNQLESSETDWHIYGEVIHGNYRKTVFFWINGAGSMLYLRRNKPQSLIFTSQHSQNQLHRGCKSKGKRQNNKVFRKC